MELDVVIPATRPESLERTLYSFSRGTRRPDRVTVVSNEVPSDLPVHGLAARLIRFRSSRYPVGRMDSALRRNIGIWSSGHSHVLLFDDDQVAPADLLEASLRLLREKPCFWGHYRYIPFASHTVDNLLHAPPARGRTREHPANAWHLWQSCYGGLFGAERSLLLDIRGLDLIFCGRHGGDDQDLGRRIARRLGGTDRVFIHEPPFAWHPEEKLRWSKPGYTNLCTEHQLEEAQLADVRVERCTACPYFRALEEIGFRSEVRIPFDPREVETVVEDLA